MFYPARSPYAFYTKVMWNWYKDDPDHIDLSTLTFADIEVTGTGKIDCVMICIENGYLRSIDMYQDLTQSMY